MGGGRVRARDHARPARRETGRRPRSGATGPARRGVRRAAIPARRRRRGVRGPVPGTAAPAGLRAGRGPARRLPGGVRRRDAAAPVDVVVAGADRTAARPGHHRASRPHLHACRAGPGDGRGPAGPCTTSSSPTARRNGRRLRSCLLLPPRSRRSGPGAGARWPGPGHPAPAPLSPMCSLSPSRPAGPDPGVIARPRSAFGRTGGRIGLFTVT